MIAVFYKADLVFAEKHQLNAVHAQFIISLYDINLLCDF